MVNVGLNSGSLLGFLLAIAGAGLYFLRSVRPELARDHDIFFAAIGLLCGFILIFQGWRLDPILQFGQVLLAGSTIFFAIESIRLRGVATEQAKRNTPIVDEERTVSRRYYQEAELDEYEPLEEDLPPVRGRIRPSADSRPSRDPYESESRRRPASNSRSRGDRSDSRSDSRSERGNSASSLDRSSRNRRPRPESSREDWGEVSVDWEEKPSRRPSGGSSGSSSRRPSNISDEDRETPRRPRRSRPTGEAPSRRRPEADSSPADYVDYQPVNYTEGYSEDSDRPTPEDDRAEDNRKERDDSYDYPVRNEDNRDERDDTYDYPVR